LFYDIYYSSLIDIVLFFIALSLFNVPAMNQST